MTKLGAAFYFTYYSTRFYALKEYTPYRTVDGRLIWRFSKYISSGGTANRLERAGYKVGNWHNKPVITEEIDEQARQHFASFKMEGK